MSSHQYPYHITIPDHTTHGYWTNFQLGPLLFGQNQQLSGRQFNTMTLVNEKHRFRDVDVKASIWIANMLQILPHTRVIIWYYITNIYMSIRLFMQFLGDFKCNLCIHRSNRTDKFTWQLCGAWASFLFCFWHVIYFFFVTTILITLSVLQPISKPWPERLSYNYLLISCSIPYHMIP